MTRNGLLCRRPIPNSVEDCSPSPASSPEHHVLAVDDSLVDRKVIERLLKISAYKVTTVDSGKRALQFLGLDEDRGAVGFDGLKVSMIVTDYCMPGMTGYELLKKIKESSTFSDIPVVIMSSENVSGRIDRCLEEGAEEFLMKPVKLSDVKRLASYIKKGEKKQAEERGTHKRKFQSTSSQEDDLSSSSPSSTSTSTSPSSTLPSSPSSSSSSEPLLQRRRTNEDDL